MSWTNVHTVVEDNHPFPKYSQVKTPNSNNNNNNIRWTLVSQWRQKFTVGAAASLAKPNNAVRDPKNNNHTIGTTANSAAALALTKSDESWKAYNSDTATTAYDSARNGSMALATADAATASKKSNALTTTDAPTASAKQRDRILILRLLLK